MKIKAILFCICLLSLLLTGCNSTYNTGGQQHASLVTEIIYSDGVLQRVYYYCEDLVTCYGKSGCQPMSETAYNRHCKQ